MQTETTTERQMPAPRHLRRMEYWEQPFERFPGATVLDDLELFPDDADACRWILVRYTAVRAAASLIGKGCSPRELRIERSAGLNYLDAMPMLDREAWSLRKMLEVVAPDPPIAVVMRLIDAAAVAVRRGHRRGGYAMYHVAYRLSVPRLWHAEAARAARGIEKLSLEAGAVYSPRIWRRRAYHMEKMAGVA